MVASLKLKPNANSRVLAGHPWVFANECEALLPASHDGEVVECRDRTSRFLGTGIYNSKSQIVWRRLSRDRIELGEAYLRAALTRALARRGLGGTGSLLPSGDMVQSGVRALPFQRLVWSESDDLPGVVVDQFGETLVLQIQTLAMEKRSAVISDLLAGLTGAR